MDHDGKEVEAQFPPFFFLYKDGSLRRSDAGRLTVPVPELAEGRVASKDVTFNSDLGLWARIFLPPSPSHIKLPIVLYFHGGGFIFGSPAWNNFHDFCTDMAARSSSICVSASYRLAPEHRLPASIEDGFTALQWLHSQSLLQADGKEQHMDEWLARADFSKCFIAGESAGGTLAHHVTMRAMNKPLSYESWQPLCIRGLILIHPGFVRATQTQEELDCPQDSVMNWEAAHVCMRLACPLGSSEGNIYLNPLPNMSSPFVLPKTLVALADKDGVHFMGLEYVRVLKDAGCKVDMVMSKGVGHVFFIAEPQSEQALILMQRITNFITEKS